MDSPVQLDLCLFGGHCKSRCLDLCTNGEQEAEMSVCETAKLNTMYSACLTDGIILAIFVSILKLCRDSSAARTAEALWSLGRSTQYHSTIPQEHGAFPANITVQKRGPQLRSQSSDLW